VSSFFDSCGKIRKIMSHMNKKPLMLARIYRWPHLALVLIVLVVLALHIVALVKTSGLIFDEIYYVAEARNGAAIGQFTPHPPLAKLFITSGIRLFGDNPVGWRFFSILFGVVGIVLFYFICAELKMSRKAQLIATFLFAFETLSFLQSSVAMLDVYSATLMLGAFLLFLRSMHFGTAVSLAASALAKLPGVLAFPVMFIYTLANKRRLLPVLLAGVVAAGSFLLLLEVLNFTLSHNWESPVSLITSYLNNIPFSDGTPQLVSRPWEWLIYPRITFIQYNPQYIEALTPTIWFLLIPSLCYMGFRAIKGRDEAAIFGFSWFGVIYLPWLAASLILDRVTYLYYLYPAVGAICLGIGIGLADLWELGKRQASALKSKTIFAVIASVLLVHLSLFVVMSPFSMPMFRWLPDNLQLGASFTSQLHIGRGEDWAAAGSYDQAVVEYNKAIDINPDSIQALFFRAIAYLRLKKYELAIDDCDKVLSSSPNYAEVYYVRASAYTELEQYNAAIADCNKAIQIRPGFGLAYFARGRALIRSGQKELGYEDIAFFVKIDPSTADQMLKGYLPPIK
jgi:dolichyl-phosphate-mannose-protein mannosyltransferase